MIALVALLALGAVPEAAACRAPSSVFATERECRLWRAVVELEGEVRTATTAAATYRRKLVELEALPPLVVTTTITRTRPTAFDWRPAGVVVAGALGGGLGAAVSQEKPAGAMLGALLGAALAWGAEMIAEVLDDDEEEKDP